MHAAARHTMGRSCDVAPLELRPGRRRTPRPLRFTFRGSAREPAFPLAGPPAALVRLFSLAGGRGEHEADSDLVPEAREMGSQRLDRVPDNRLDGQRLRLLEIQDQSRCVIRPIELRGPFGWIVEDREVVVSPGSDVLRVEIFGPVGRDVQLRYDLLTKPSDVTDIASIGGSVQASVRTSPSIAATLPLIALKRSGWSFSARVTPTG